MQMLFGKMGAGLLIAACAVLVLPGCQKPIRPPVVSGDYTETGTLMLTVNRQGAARTILPIWPAETGDFAAFTLVFTAAHDDNQSRVVQNWTPGTPVELYAGTWELHVTAYLPGDWGGGTGDPLAGHPTFEGSHPGIAVPPGGTVNGNVVLSPVATAGRGTFSWDLDFDASIVAASMKILREDFSRYRGPYYILHIDSVKVTLNNPGFFEMDAGRYIAVFTLYDYRGESVEDSRALRIYRNMYSVFNHMFDGVPVSPLCLVLGAWNQETGFWDFFEHGIDAWFFRTFLPHKVGGVTDSNFDDIARWFDKLTTAYTVPADEAGLRYLVDAALIGIAGENAVFTRATNLWTQPIATNMIIDVAVNVTLSAVDFTWATYYTVNVRVGVHSVPVAFVPVPVTGVMIHGTSFHLLEETDSLNLSATVEPYYVRHQHQGIRWEIPDVAGAEFVTLYYNEADGTANVTGVAWGTAVIYAVSVANPSHRAEVTVEVFPYGAEISISPTSIPMIRGGTPQQFTATVGPDGASQYVEWFVYPAPEGVSINPAYPVLNQTTVLTLGGMDVGHDETLTVTARIPGTSLTAVATVNVIVIPTGVTMGPFTPTMIRGGTPQQFTARVEPQGAPQNLTWVVEPHPAGVQINALTGVLTVGPEVTPGVSFTVRAVHGAFSEYVTITVATPEPERVVLNPAGANVLRGTTRQFNATVVGPPGTLNEVTWYVYPSTGGEITGQGLLTVGTNATGTLTVRARAVRHVTVYGEATVTVLVRENFAIDFSDIRNEARYIEFTAPAVSYLNLLDGQPMVIHVTGTDGLGIESFAWFFGGVSIDNTDTGVTVSNGGTTLAMNYSILNRIGRNRVTLEVLVDGVPFSRVITFYVTL